MRAEAAAAALGLQALAYVAGQVARRLAVGPRSGGGIVGLRRRSWSAGGVVAAIGSVAVAARPSPSRDHRLHGIGTGATIAVRSAAFSDVFGGPTFGTIFGLLAVAYPVGGTLAVYRARSRSTRPVRTPC